MPRRASTPRRRGPRHRPRSPRRASRARQLWRASHRPRRRAGAWLKSSACDAHELQVLVTALDRRLADVADAALVDLLVEHALFDAGPFVGHEAAALDCDDLGPVL